jgi:hypothetical protein
MAYNCQFNAPTFDDFGTFGTSTSVRGHHWAATNECWGGNPDIGTVQDPVDVFYQYQGGQDTRLYDGGPYANMWELDDQYRIWICGQGYTDSKLYFPSASSESNSSGWLYYNCTNGKTSSGDELPQDDSYVSDTANDGSNWQSYINENGAGG